MKNLKNKIESGKTVIVTLVNNFGEATEIAMTKMGEEGGMKILCSEINILNGAWHGTFAELYDFDYGISDHEFGQMLLELILKFGSYMVEFNFDSVEGKLTTSSIDIDDAIDVRDADFEHTELLEEGKYSIYGSSRELLLWERYGNLGGMIV